jgi:hypothetical protein
MTPAEAALVRENAYPESHEVRKERIRKQSELRFRNPSQEDPWHKKVTRTTRDLAFEFNHAMSQNPVPESEYVEHSYESQSWGPKCPTFSHPNGTDGGKFQLSAMSSRMCHDFADAVKRAQWPVDRVEVEKWEIKEYKSFTCRLYWKKKKTTDDDPKPSHSIH